MPIDKFKFVSPGVQVAEIDNSQLPDTPAEVGPVIVGRSRRGPGLRPVQVNSMSEFVEIFGNPIPGGETQDVWRNPDAVAPAYGTYAAQAYLRNSSPITYVRLLGDADPGNAGAGADGTPAANGGAGWKIGNTPDANGVGGAFGLFLMPSSSTGVLFGDNVKQSTAVTGTLAAIIYATTGSIQLSGAIGTGSVGALTRIDATIQGRGVNTLVKSDGGKLNIFISSSADAASVPVHSISGTAGQKSIVVDFQRGGKDYIRRKLNTDPTKTNSSIVAGTAENYTLGETFDSMVAKHVPDATTGGTYYAWITPLANATATQNSQLRSSKKARTGYVFAQYTGVRSNFQPQDQQQLFRFVAHGTGEDTSQGYKISIRDIKAPTNEFSDYGTFTVEIRRASDTDAAPQVLETFPLCNLNPASPNYVAKVIGDKYVEWDSAENYYREYGNYANKSKFVYIEMNRDVDEGRVDDTSLLPFGFFGPVKHRPFMVASNTTGTLDPNSGGEIDTAADKAQYGITGRPFLEPYADINGRMVPTGSTASRYQDFVFAGDGCHFTASFLFPELRTRTSSSQGDVSSPRDAYFGISTGRSDSAFDKYDESYVDLVRCLPDGYGDQDGAGSAVVDVSGTTNDLTYSFIFSLDDLKLTGSGQATWHSGTMMQGDSMNSGSYSNCLSLGFDKFTMPLVGGFDGLNITEAEAFNNTRALEGKSSLTSYAVYSAKKAFNTVADAEVVESNMMTIPGVYASNIQDHMIRICENRADSLAIIDLKGDYTPTPENSANAVSRKGDVDTTINNLNDRALNTSYAAAYYPWVRISDSETGGTLWVPPSVPAIGTLSSAQRRSELWFAPAGFTRGGLTEGAAGVPVNSVAQRLRQKDRDDLYAANINPIATFPAEGIVIFGQKTLQVTPSALDRINVRRLMIYVKREISFIASRLLFEQNVQATWDRFTGQVSPFLDSIVARQGLTDYRVILDETTTTPDLVDRNTIYAKIFLKPARAVEFIAIDFVITRSGAAFED